MPKRIFRFALLLLVALPAALIITLMLWPLWSWIEEDVGIESIGHSGPSEWCFLAVYALLFTVLLMGKLLHWKKESRKSGKHENF